MSKHIYMTMTTSAGRKVSLFSVVAILMATVLTFLSSYVLAEEQAKGNPIQYQFGHQYQIHSKVLSEERSLLVYLPEEYQGSSDKFPVLYVLEGDVHYKHAVVSAEKIQKSGWMPASIIVAIVDNEGTNVRDYRTESDKFLRFINEDVQPFVAENFRVNGFKTVFGHAMSGKFLLEAFIKNPEEFNNYIVANPYSMKDGILDRFEVFLDKNKKLDQALYFSVGTVIDNGPYNVEPVEALAELLKKKAPKGLQWKYQYIPLHGAHSSANVTLYDGLSDTFSDYLGEAYTYQDFVEMNGMEGIKAVFRERAKKYHISDEVDIGTFMGLGFSFMDNGHPKEAVDLITDAIRNYYPESAQLHRVLGRAYLKMEDYKQAYKAYEIMVRLAKQQKHPRLDGFQNLLEQVGKKL